MYKIALAFLFALLFTGCDVAPSSDQIQSQRQETIQQEMASQLGMPAIKNFSEMRLLKMVLEMRDQNIPTYTYTYSEMTGKFRFMGHTIGFGIPYATQYTSPDKVARYGAGSHYLAVPQADPNGLFSPASAEGTWILMKDPNGTDVSPIYVEPRITVSKFKLPASIVAE